MKVAPTALIRQRSSFRERNYHAHTSWDLWALGVTIVIGGQFFSWNSGVVAGTVSFGLSVGAVGLAYVCLACSMAEMTSMLPFAGGVYGLARCSLGFYAGFILGCCELLEYVFYVSSINVSLGRTVAAWWPEWTPYQPCVWLISYLISISILSLGGKLFWKFNLLLAVLLIVQVLVFCIGSAPNANILKYSGGQDYYFVGGWGQWLKSMPMAMWFFVGIEALNTLCHEVEQPKTNIPRGQVACALTVFISSFAVYFMAISLPPGIKELPKVLAIFDGGYSLILDIPLTDATLYSIPACFASAPGFLLASANILTALAESKLVPHCLHKRHPELKTPVNAILCTSLLSFALCFSQLYSPNAGMIFYKTSMLFATFTYTSQGLGYLFLKRRYKSLHRLYRSPLGVGGVVYSSIIFMLCCASILGFQDKSGVEIIPIVSILIVLTIYYHGFAKLKQTFSDEERKILFFAHVANHNNSKHRRKKKMTFKQAVKLTTKAAVLTTKTNNTSAASPVLMDIPALAIS